jgi:hypothetical protein
MPRTLSLTSSVFMWLTFHLGLPTCAVLRPSSTQSVAFRTASWYFTIVCLVFTPLVTFSTLLYTFPKHARASLISGSDSRTVAASAVLLAFYTTVLQLCYGRLPLIFSNLLSSNHPYRHNIISSSNSDQASLRLAHNSIPLSSITCFSHAAGSFEPPAPSECFYGICARPWQRIHTYS